MAVAMAHAGAHVVLNARQPGPLEELREELKRQGHSASIANFDVTDEDASRAHLDAIAKSFGRLDVIVNNASAGRPGTLEDADRRDFEQAYLVNVVAPFQIIKAATPLLKEAARKTRGGASVVNICSMYGVVSPDPRIYGQSGANNPPYYGAAKAALIQFTRYAACHLGRTPNPRQLHQPRSVSFQAIPGPRPRVSGKVEREKSNGSHRGSG